MCTWNLCTRIATGRAPYDIEINGIPLVFYHFSGFDSGGQKIMLERYGTHSPVLFDLREWYIARCEELGQSTLGQIDCVYNRFSNGEPITTEHRLLYRRREDLIRAFPDPFDTTDPARSYFHWYLADQASVAPPPPSIKRLAITPLAPPDRSRGRSARPGADGGSQSEGIVPLAGDPGDHALQDGGGHRLIDPAPRVHLSRSSGERLPLAEDGTSVRSPAPGSRGSTCRRTPRPALLHLSAVGLQVDLDEPFQRKPPHPAPHWRRALDGPVRSGAGRCRHTNGTSLERVMNFSAAGRRSLGYDHSPTLPQRCLGRRMAVRRPVPLPAP